MGRMTGIGGIFFHDDLKSEAYGCFASLIDPEGNRIELRRRRKSQR